jgi:hypothetical protein
MDRARSVKDGDKFAEEAGSPSGGRAL